MNSFFRFKKLTTHTGSIFIDAGKTSIAISAERIALWGYGKMNPTYTAMSLFVKTRMAYICVHFIVPLIIG
jgi:hypothetical protein